MSGIGRGRNTTIPAWMSAKISLQAVNTPSQPSNMMVGGQQQQNNSNSAEAEGSKASNPVGQPTTASLASLVQIPYLRSSSRPSVSQGTSSRSHNLQTQAEPVQKPQRTRNELQRDVSKQPIVHPVQQAAAIFSSPGGQFSPKNQPAYGRTHDTLSQETVELNMNNNNSQSSALFSKGKQQHIATNKTGKKLLDTIGVTNKQTNNKLLVDAVVITTTAVTQYIRRPCSGKFSRKLGNCCE